MNRYARPSRGGGIAFHCKYGVARRRGKEGRIEARKAAWRRGLGARGRIDAADRRLRLLGLRLRLRSRDRLRRRLVLRSRLMLGLMWLLTLRLTLTNRLMLGRRALTNRLMLLRLALLNRLMLRLLMIWIRLVVRLMLRLLALRLMALVRLLMILRLVLGLLTLLRRLTLRLLIRLLLRVGLLLIGLLVLALVGIALAVAIHPAHVVIGGSHRPALAVLVVLAFAVRLHDPVIMLGVLIEVLGGDAVARRGGLTRHGDIALEHLIGVAANLDAGAAAVEILRTIGRARSAVVLVITAATAAHHVVVTAAPRPILLAWSHVTLRFVIVNWFKTLCLKTAESDLRVRPVITVRF
jgi:hypothetical protein